MNFKILKEKISLDTFKNKKLIWLVVGLSGLMALCWDYKASPDKNITNADISASVDTIIPRGYTLVPIEVQNYEALDSVFGNYGVVTLYSVPESGQGQPKKLAERVKMLRAPQNPSQFGVLIRDSEADTIAGHIGPVFVILHNRSVDAGGVQTARVLRPERFRIVEESE